MSLATEWAVFFNGLNVSRRMNRYVEAIECTGNSGGTADSARLTFNDKDGRLTLPPKGAPVMIQIQGRTRFKGFADSPECVISRGGGMLLEVACSGFKKTGKVKQGLNVHKDDCTLQDFLDEVSKKAGVSSVKVSEELGQIKRAYWSTRGMNFLQLGQSLGDEFGATFKMRADDAVLAKRGQGLAPGGGSTPMIIARRPGNLIECRISPFEGRQRWGKARVRYYDRKKAKWKSEDVEIGNAPGGADVVDLLGGARHDKESAKQAGEGRKTQSEREGGSGSLTISIEPDAEAEGTCIVQGVRTGINGSYRIESWTDKVTRKGAETSLNVKQPQDDGGK